MSQHRHALPQLTGGAFMIDGGIETPLICHILESATWRANADS